MPESSDWIQISGSHWIHPKLGYIKCVNKFEAHPKIGEMRLFDTFEEAVDYMRFVVGYKV